MDTTTVAKPAGRTLRQLFERELAGTSRIVASAVTRSRTCSPSQWPEVFYAAVEDLDRKGRVYGLVGLVARNSQAGTVTYKLLAEFVGPNETRCPQRILDQLTDIVDSDDPHGWAREWREDCAENNRQNAGRSTRRLPGCQAAGTLETVLLT
ncbi:MAG: hypothetical protein ACP5P1_14795 [Acidimicrobiales bacterium]